VRPQTLLTVNHDAATLSPTAVRRFFRLLEKAYCHV